MTPRGLDALVEIRKAGKLPCKQVLLWFGNFKPSEWTTYGELGMYPEGVCKGAGEDFRVLVGLDVCLVAETYSDALVKVFEAVKKYAAFILVVPLDWGGDMLMWQKGGELCPC